VLGVHTSPRIDPCKDMTRIGLTLNRVQFMKITRTLHENPITETSVHGVDPSLPDLRPSHRRGG